MQSCVAFLMRLWLVSENFSRKQVAYFGVTAIADVTTLIVKYFANITRYDTDITKYYKF